VRHRFPHLSSHKTSKYTAADGVETMSVHSHFRRADVVTYGQLTQNRLLRARRAQDILKHLCKEIYKKIFISVWLETNSSLFVKSTPNLTSLHPIASTNNAECSVDSMMFSQSLTN
jgi:hypothetical protein